MLDRFLKQSVFTSQEDFQKNFEFIIPENFNFAFDVMDEWAKMTPDRLALLWCNDKGEERRFTFEDIRKESNKVASYLLSLGISKGDFVMLILKRRYQFWLTMLALHKIGAVAIPASFQLTKKDIVYRIKNANVKAIVACGDKEILRSVNEAHEEWPALKHRISIGPDIPEGWEDFNAGVEASPEYKGENKTKSSDYLLMYFTSGTNGEPKMAIHDHTYPIGHIGTAAYWHCLHMDSLHLTVADTGWAKATWGKMYGQWIAGATLFVYDHEKFTPADILNKIGEYRITSFCAPPTIYRFMIREDLSHFDLSSLEHVTTAGEALNSAVYEKFLAATGLEIKEGFGQSEGTCLIATTAWMKTKPGSMGKPMPQYDIHLLKEDGTEAGVGEQGQIVIRTEERKQIGLCCEYYNNPEATHKAWHDGYYFTGDLAYKDEDGYYWFIGRVDDVIKSSGYRIGPFEVESALMTHPAVVECAITGVPDEIRGMIVKATVVLGKEWKNKAGDDLKKELQTHVKQVTAPYKYPRIVEFVDELPKTHSGKIRRVEIRQNDADKLQNDAKK
ncbi:MAG: AMP-binding protein [Prevotellaceae bacterium]|nr:AMP-binding protein [Prevotellaceae bacterium]